MPVAFGGGATETIISAPALGLLCLAILLILTLPRKFVIIPVLLGLFFIPEGNTFVVGGLHLQPVRVLSLFGCLRLLIISLMSPRDLSAVKWQKFDWIFITWAIWRSAAVMLLWQTQPAFLLECGHLWSGIGMYLVLRFLIQDSEDVLRVIKVFGIIVIVNCAGMVVEQYRHVNFFGTILGGVATAPALRNGRYRSQGTFQHAILAGVFAATLLPLLGIVWKDSKSKVFALVAAGACMIMIFASASSTPVGALVALVAAMFLWPLRKNMRLLRWCLVLALTFLHLVMKAPVWFLIARVNLVEGSTAYFRAYLVDQFVKRFSEWWLIGVLSSEDWGESMWDLSNQFVAEGQTGGILTFVLFIAMIKMCYARLGNARKRVDGDTHKEWTYWLIGCTFFTHINAYFGVSYWDHTQYAWFALLVMTMVITEKPAVTEVPKKVAEVRDAELSPWFRESASPFAVRKSEASL